MIIMECTKIKYDTESEANQALIKIVEGNDWRVWKQAKTPSRFYLCTKCNFYHLTSKVKTW